MSHLVFIEDNFRMVAENRKFTIGKSYKIDTSTVSTRYVTDDCGKKFYLHSWRDPKEKYGFISLSEYRERKINNILK